MGLIYIYMLYYFTNTWLHMYTLEHRSTWIHLKYPTIFLYCHQNIVSNENLYYMKSPWRRRIWRQRVCLQRNSSSRLVPVAFALLCPSKYTTHLFSSHGIFCLIIMKRDYYTRLFKIANILMPKFNWKILVIFVVQELWKCHVHILIV